MYEIVRRDDEFFDLDIHAYCRRKQSVALHASDLARVAKRSGGTARASALEALDNVADVRLAARTVATALGLVVTEFVEAEEREVRLRSREAWTLVARDIIASLFASDDPTHIDMSRDHDVYSTSKETPELTRVLKVVGPLERHEQQTLLRAVDDEVSMMTSPRPRCDMKALIAFFARRPRFSRLRFSTRVHRSCRRLRTLDDDMPRVWAFVSVHQIHDTLACLVEEVGSCRHIPVHWPTDERRALVASLRHVTTEQAEIQFLVLLDDLIVRDGDPAANEPPLVAEFMQLKEDVPDYDNGRSRDIMNEFDDRITAKWGSHYKPPAL